MLLTRDEKIRIACLIAKNCKQPICKSSGLKILIKLSFYKKTFLIWRWIIFFMICYAFCQCHNLSTSALLELK